MHGLHSLLGARTAYASTSVIHLGLGGSTCCTSYFTWGIPGVMSPNGPTTFSGSPGSTVLPSRSEEHTSELQSRLHLVCRLLLEKKKKDLNTREKDRAKHNQRD